MRYVEWIKSPFRATVGYLSSGLYTTIPHWLRAWQNLVEIHHFEPYQHISDVNMLGAKSVWQEQPLIIDRIQGVKVKMARKYHGRIIGYHYRSGMALNFGRLQTVCPNQWSVARMSYYLAILSCSYFSRKLWFSEEIAQMIWIPA